MLFHSPGFLFIFLPLFLVLLLLASPGVGRSLVLLVFSYLFYSGGEPFFVLVLLISSLTDFTAALCLQASSVAWRRRIWLIASICINLGLLFFYKYGGWMIPHISSLANSVGIPTPTPDFFKTFVLPAGISFYTFQSMSYTIDVYRGVIAPERSLLGFCNYVAYLPQLIAGPIERYAHLSPQLRTLTHGRMNFRWSEGLDRILLGIVQKLLIADSCAYVVDRLVQLGGTQDFFTSWAIALGFGMQIYFDFAAYTHMAIGISLLLGVRLQENFLSPYKASSIQDFWRRWHITLSAWFRDYVYIPLGGSRHGSARTFLNLLVTFVLCGLWHGAGWNFLFWGTAHGFLLGAYHLKKRWLPRWVLPRPLAVMVTFVAVHFIWVPFRVADRVQIVRLWEGMLGLNGVGGGAVTLPDLAFVLAVAFAVLLFPNAAERWPGRSGWAESSGIASLALFAIFTSPNITKFIYFQF